MKNSLSLLPPALSRSMWMRRYPAKYKKRHAKKSIPLSHHFHTTFHTTFHTAFHASFHARFHANFDTMRSDRDAFTGEMEGPDSLEWELTEQTAWEVWEEALRAAAALAHASVGPGWRYQMQLRQQLNYEAELRSMYGTTLHQRNQVVFDDFSDGGSSLGSYSFDVSNPQSSHYSQRLRPPGADILPNAVESFRVVIPEVLPAAMVRFAASVIDCTPTLRDADSKIIWEEDQTQQQMQSIILQLINEERRWIRRLKRLGDTQRLVVTHVTS